MASGCVLYRKLDLISNVSQPIKVIVVFVVAVIVLVLVVDILFVMIVAAKNQTLKFGQNRVSNSRDIVVVDGEDDDFVVVGIVVFDPRILPLKFG